MVKLDLLPRKVFELTLEDGTVIQGQFGTWALSRFGEKKNLGLSQMLDFFRNDAKLKDMLDFVLCAIEYKERESKKPLTFDDMKLCKWLDDYTEETGEEGTLSKLFNHASPDDKSEKKTDHGLNGENSKELQLQPEL